MRAGSKHRGLAIQGIKTVDFLYLSLILYAIYCKMYNIFLLNVRNIEIAELSFMFVQYVSNGFERNIRRLYVTCNNFETHVQDGSVGEVASRKIGVCNRL